MAHSQEPTVLYTIPNIRGYRLYTVEEEGQKAVNIKTDLNGNAAEKAVGESLALMMVPTSAPSEYSSQEQDFYLHLELGNSTNMPLPASSQIFHKPPRSYLIPRWDLPGKEFLELEFPPIGKGVTQEDVDTFETILAQCTAFLERERPPVGGESLPKYDPSGYKPGEGYVKGTGNHAGQIVLVDEENGSVLGELGQDAEVIEDPRVKHGSKQPVEVEFSQDGRKMYIQPASDEVFQLAEHPAYKNSTLVKNAAAASRLLITSSSALANAMSSGAEGFTRSTKPAEKPMTFNPATHARVRKIHGFTSSAAGLSAKTVGQATKYAQHLGAAISGRGERQRKIDKDGYKPGLLNKSMIAFSTIADGIAYSGKNIIGAGANAASTMVGHKYGAEAGSIAGDLAGGLKNVAVVYVDVTGVSRKAVIKSVAKGMVVGRSANQTVVVGGGDGGDVPHEMQQAQNSYYAGVKNDNMGPGQVRSGTPTNAPGMVGFGNATAQGYSTGVGENIAGSSLQGQHAKNEKSGWPNEKTGWH